MRILTIGNMECMLDPEKDLWPFIHYYTANLDSRGSWNRKIRRGVAFSMYSPWVVRNFHTSISVSGYYGGTLWYLFSLVNIHTKGGVLLNKPDDMFDFIAS